MKLKNQLVIGFALLFAGLLSDGKAQLIQRNYNGTGLLYANTPGVTEIGMAPSVQTPITNTGASYTVGTTDVYLIANIAGTQTITLPSATTCAGRMIVIRTITANTVVSATSNVVPLIGGSAGTAILAATAGKWVELVSDGTNWQTMEGN